MSRLCVHRLVEQLVPRAAAALRAVHRGVRVAQEARGTVGGPSRDRDADARGDHDLSVLEREGLTERADRAIGELFDLMLVGEVFADDDELVASESRHGVVAADRRREPTPHGDEQLVAGVVAEPVVDDLESVEVDEEHRNHRCFVAEAGERGVEPLDRQRAVRQVGERVVECEMTELLGVRGAVESDAHETADPFHDRLLGIRRLPRGAHVDRQHSQEALVVGRTDRHGPERPEPVRRRQLTEFHQVRKPRVFVDVADDDRLVA